jgi:NADPH:quinone reductase-like Zn-dependent oxidoreductase
MKIMKSYWMQVRDGQGQLELRDTDVPVPGAGQLLVRVRAAGLNRGEFLLAHGLHAKGGGNAKAVGTEAAGEVVACGAEVFGWKPGDHVMGRCPGAFAEYVLLDQREAMRRPSRLSWEEAAAIPLTSMVVHDMLVLQGRLQAGDWVLIPGVSSGVGLTAMMMAKALGARVIGTSGSQDKLDRLRDLGLDLGLKTRLPDFKDAVLRATDGQGVNLVINTVGGTVFAECLRCMAFEGRLATVGYVDGVLGADLDLEALHSKRLTLFGVSNKLRSTAQRAQGVPDFVAQILPLIESGRITPLVDQVFPFEQLPQAKAVMDASTHLGKLVLAGLL